jgi:hypothetical protein
MDTKALLSSLFEPYKEGLKKNLVAWSTLIFSIICYYLAMKPVEPLETWLIFIPFFSFLFVYIQIVLLDRKLDYALFKSVTAALIFLSALFWVHVWYGAAHWFFAASTIVLTVFIMYRRREFLGRSMALVETEIFGAPQTKKWRDKLEKERTTKDT